MHSGLSCCAWRCKKVLAKRTQERKETWLLCWAVLNTGLSCVQTGCFYLEWLRQGVFILGDKASCSVSKHVLDTGSSRFPEISPAMCYLFLLFAAASGWCLLCTAGGSSPLWSLSALPLLSPFLQNRELVLFHSARSWITPWVVGSLPVRFARVSKMKLRSRLPLTWLMGALTSIPWRGGLTHWSNALLQAFY